MIGKTFDEEVQAIFAQNGFRRLYNDQFMLLIERLKREYSLLNDHKMSQLRSGGDSPLIARLDHRIAQNRAQIMFLYKTTVGPHV